MSDDLFLGFDLSTQQVKCCAVKISGEVVTEIVVDFENDFPDYKTTRGYYARTDGSKEVVAPVSMWLEAVDLTLDRLKASGFSFERVRAISGDAQQHGTVYWNMNAANILQSLDAGKTLKEQLGSCFSKPLSPIWMDFSTAEQCENLNKQIGEEAILEISGSVATERFGGPQIMRIVDMEPEAYQRTDRISIISSFFCSLFVGRYAPIDFNEATGTNLYDFREKQWSRPICEAIDRNLIDKLGDVVPSHTIIGSISDYFVKRYGFAENMCQIVAFTGDNAASLFSSGLRRDDILVTLGSSDCDFFVTDQPTPRRGCHVFGSAMNPNEYFLLCCFKNSSLARQKVRDDCGIKTWDEFDELIAASTKPGNDGNFGVYFFVSESCPPGAVGCIREDAHQNKLEKFPNVAVECRAILESQIVARLHHAEQSGFAINFGVTRVLLTGGASKNRTIPQIFADAFQSNVYTTDNPNSAAYGSALRAMHAIGKLNPELVEGKDWILAAKPRHQYAEIYFQFKKRYQEKLLELLPIHK